MSVAGARVILHRVGRGAQGPVDSVLADAAGRFVFRFRPDTSALYLLSARYGGIEYFSPPVRTKAASPDTGIRLVVYDTSSSTPIGVEARHIVVPRAGDDGARAVLDLIVLLNDGRRARVSPDSTRPSWEMILPRGTGELEVGEGDVSPDAVIRVGDTVRVLAPLAPGQKQISLQYAVVPVDGRIAFPAGSGQSVNVLVEERTLQVSGGRLALADSQVIEGRAFRRFTGEVPAGGAVVLTVGVAGAAALSRWALPVLVSTMALVLALAAWRFVGRRAVAPSAGSTGTASSPQRLLDALAALDAQYAGRESEVAPDVWARYVADRARLRAQLADVLAAGRSSS